MAIYEEGVPAPKCPLCGIRERDLDTEPPGPFYYSDRCTTCSGLTGTRTHSHVCRSTPAQIAAGNGREGNSWRTTTLMCPLWENGVHVGFFCTETHNGCTFVERFTPEQMELCPVEHKTHAGFPAPLSIKGMCFNNWDHRMERGEIEGPYGYITDYGRQVERERSDAQVWDPLTGRTGEHRYAT